MVHLVLIKLRKSKVFFNTCHKQFERQKRPIIYFSHQNKCSKNYQRVIKKVPISCDGHVNLYLQWYLHLLGYVNLGDVKFECGDPNLVQYL